MKKILCIGQSTYDTTYVVENYPKENSKIKAKAIYEMGGGSAGNSAYLLAKYGEDVSIITSFGTDSFGIKMKNEYEEIGVDLKNSVIKDGYITPSFTIMTSMENGSRTIVGYTKKNLLPENYKPVYTSAPEIIVLDGYETETAKKALKEFPDAVSILDAGGLKNEFIELGSLVSYFICSEDFARDYCRLEKIEEKDFEKLFLDIEKITDGTIVITLGNRGCLYKKDGQVLRMPTFKAKVVDTTAAGDIFHGAFAYAIGNGYSLEEALSFASATSSLSVEKYGGRISIPELSEIHEMLAKNERLL